MKKLKSFVLRRLHVFGDLVVYRRGSWARRERLPRYLVSQESTGRDLEEFRREASAVKWAKAQKEGQANAVPS